MKSIFSFIRNETWQSNVFVKGRELNKEVAAILTELKIQGFSERKIAKLLKIGRNSIRRWKKPSAPVPLLQLKKLISLLPTPLRKEKEEKVTFKTEEISTHQKRRWIKIPKKVTPELARVLGRHAGDGSITFITHRVKLTEGALVTVKEHMRDMKKVFNVEMKLIKGDGNFWECEINSLPLALILNRFFEMPIGRKSETVSEPSLIKKSKIDIRKEFLKGVIETDGGIWKDKNGTLHVEIEVNSKSLAKSCHEILEVLGFSPTFFSRMLKGKERFRVRVKKHEVKKLLSLLRLHVKNLLQLPESG